MTFIRWLWRQVLLLVAWFNPAGTPAELSATGQDPGSPPIRRYALVHLTEDPDTLEPYTLYAVGEHGHVWHVAMICPCGCGATIGLNMLPDDSPRWALSDGTDGPTLTPSVWRTSGCRSHFVLRRGRITWCGAPASRDRPGTL